MSRRLASRAKRPTPELGAGRTTRHPDGAETSEPPEPTSRSGPSGGSPKIGGTDVRAIRRRGSLAALTLTLILVLPACSSGSTDERAEDPAGPTETQPAGATSTGATGAEEPTAPTGSSGDEAIAGTWEGAWSSSEFDLSGTFTMIFEETADGFTGTIQVQGSDCVTDGQVTAAVDGTAITIGAVQAEQEIAFAGEVSDGAMSGTYGSPAGCGDDSGTWEATLVG